MTLLLELQEMYAERKPGCCIICDEPVPPSKVARTADGKLVYGKPYLTCSTDCEREWKRIYERAYKRRARRFGPLNKRRTFDEPSGRVIW
jgi:hypothetical protein